ncbi:hypothetical protein [Bacillus sp. CH30_1T]|uniref:hypothetical protein n=1 Tax=Bacillus sp. CH30_1T TaxID=2604836 RepID=UPI00165D7CEF|nr:hypothetical protein [Bacillus sp. CH30_1T]
MSDEETPISPTNLEATAGNGEAVLTWDASTESDLYSYHIYKDGELEYSVDPSQTELKLSILKIKKTIIISHLTY